MENVIYTFLTLFLFRGIAKFSHFLHFSPFPATGLLRKRGLDSPAAVSDKVQTIDLFKLIFYCWGNTGQRLVLLWTSGINCDKFANVLAVGVTNDLNTDKFRYDVNTDWLYWGRILERNPDKSFPPRYSQHSFALRFLFLQTHATSYSFYSSVTVHWKGERMKIW